MHKTSCRASMNITIEAFKDRISVRGRNACAVNGIATIIDLIEYRAVNGGFVHMRNVGRKTQDELDDLCREYCEGFGVDWGVVSSGNTILVRTLIEKALSSDTSVDDGGAAGRERMFGEFLEELSGRARRHLRFILPRIDHRPDDFLSFFSDERNVRRQKSIDRAATNELLVLHARLKAAIAAPTSAGADEEAPRSMISPERMQFNELIAVCTESFKIAASDMEQFGPDFLVRRFPLFRFLKLLFDLGPSFSALQVDIMRRRLGYMLDGTYTRLETIAADHDLTRERIRQISHNIPGRLRGAVARLARFLEFMTYEQLLSVDRDVVVIDDEYSRYINDREGVSFTPALYTTVFEALLSETHQRVNATYDVGTDYLVAQELGNVFPFDGLIGELTERLSAKILADYTFDLRDLVAITESIRSPDLALRVLAACELIVHEEFALPLVGFGCALLSRNTKKSAMELIVEVLEDAGKPLHVRDIADRLNERNPGMEATAESIRGNILRYDRFARYEASSTYGLKEWESGWLPTMARRLISSG